MPKLTTYPDNRRPATMEVVKRAVNMPFKCHLVVGLFIRLLLIAYGNVHDTIYDVPYTDVDYKVFTDAARHVAAGNSPYMRHTYRYSPIVAYLMVPNILLHINFGKILFSVFDILLAYAVKLLVEQQIKTKENDRVLVSQISVYCSLFWLYNPLSIAISTRGNADSVPCFVIIVSIFFLQTNRVKSLWKYFLSGFFLGLSIHLRLYPLAFSFPMYLSLGEYKINRQTTMKDGLLSLLPNKKQITLTISCVLSLFLLTLGMYFLYGYEFLFETYIYHFFRKDTRHNFSVVFYYSYLTMGQLSFDVVKTVTQIFEFVVLLVISLAFGCEAKTLPFALFCQSVVLVAYNSVLTSQYFIWFLSILPLVVHSLRVLPQSAVTMTTAWIAPQAGWLYYAYLLEFKCNNVFLSVWFFGIVFFCSNIFVLSKLIQKYDPDFCFGLGHRQRKSTIQ